MPLFRTRSRLESDLGMEYYASGRRGIGGALRRRPGDFIVEEIIREGQPVNLETERIERGGGRYTLAVLSKTSKDLLQTVSLIEKRLGAKVGFAGIKDRRAITYQLVSLDREIPGGRISLGEGVELKAVGRSAWPLAPGDLRGNRFTILVRDIDPKGFDRREAEDVDWALGYFGHQRFGTTRPNTHKVGRLLVRGDYEGAVWEFLAEPYPNEPPGIYAAREELKETRDVGRAYPAFPPGLIYERAVMRRLLEGRSCRDSINCLPPGLLRLFVNSYQSYLFNRALSARWEAHGSEVGRGDYFAPLDRWGSPSRPIKVGHDLGTPRRLISRGAAVPMVRVLGSRTVLDGADAEAYKAVLEEEGVSPACFSGLGAGFEGSLRGMTFRPIAYSVICCGPDEMNPGRLAVGVATSLPKGCYATVLLREVMRPEDPFLAGY